jgi:hypothetical protein
MIAGGEDRAHVPLLHLVGAETRSRSQVLRGGGRFGSLTHQDAGCPCRGLQQGWVEAGYRLQARVSASSALPCLAMCPRDGLALRTARHSSPC